MRHCSSQSSQVKWFQPPKLECKRLVLDVIVFFDELSMHSCLTRMTYVKIISKSDRICSDQTGVFVSIEITDTLRQPAPSWPMREWRPRLGTAPSPVSASKGPSSTEVELSTNLHCLHASTIRSDASGSLASPRPCQYKRSRPVQDNSTLLCYDYLAALLSTTTY